MIWKAICKVCLKTRLNLRRFGQPKRFSFYPKGALIHHLVRANATSFTSAYMRKLIRFVALPLSHKVLRLFGSPEAMRWYFLAKVVRSFSGGQADNTKTHCLHRSAHLQFCR